MKFQEETTFYNELAIHRYRLSELSKWLIITALFLWAEGLGFETFYPTLSPVFCAVPFNMPSDTVMWVERLDYWYIKITIYKEIIVSIVRSLRDGRPWFNFLQWKWFLLFTTAFSGLWGPPSLLLLSRCFSRGGKVAGREADNSPPSSTEIKKWVDLYLHTPIRLHGVVID